MAANVVPMQVNLPAPPAQPNLELTCVVWNTRNLGRNLAGRGLGPLPLAQRVDLIAQQILAGNPDIVVLLEIGNTPGMDVMIPLLPVIGQNYWCFPSDIAPNQQQGFGADTRETYMVLWRRDPQLNLNVDAQLLNNAGPTRGAWRISVEVNNIPVGYLLALHAPSPGHLMPAIRDTIRDCCNAAMQLDNTLPIWLIGDLNTKQELPTDLWINDVSHALHGLGAWSRVGPWNNGNPVATSLHDHSTILRTGNFRYNPYDQVFAYHPQGQLDAVVTDV